MSNDYGCHGFAAPQRGALAHDRVRAFVTAGRATFTVVNTQTHHWFTFRVVAPDDIYANAPARWFVKVLAGADNTRDYRYIGLLVADKGLIHTQGSRVARDAPSFRAFAWLWRHVDELPAYVEVWHEGRCGRCGRALTVPASIESGIGPVCAGLGG